MVIGRRRRYATITSRPRPNGILTLKSGKTNGDPATVRTVRCTLLAGRFLLVERVTTVAAGTNRPRRIRQLTAKPFVFAIAEFSVVQVRILPPAGGDRLPSVGKLGAN